MTLEEARQLSSRFYSLVDSRDLALRRGARLREEMWDKIDSGQLPDCYRYQSLKRGAQSVVKHLSRLAEEFNLENPRDRASSDDMIDILERALLLLKKD